MPPNGFNLKKQQLGKLTVLNQLLEQTEAYYASVTTRYYAPLTIIHRIRSSYPSDTSLYLFIISSFHSVFPLIFGAKISENLNFLRKNKI